MSNKKQPYRTTKSFTVGDRVRVVCPWYTGQGEISKIKSKYEFVITVDKPEECTSAYNSDHSTLILSLNRNHMFYQYKKFKTLSFITKQSLTDEQFYKDHLDVA